MMAYELDDKKVTYTLLMTRLDSGKIRYSGFVRITDANGDSTLRMTTNLDAGTTFDDIEFLSQTPDPNSAYGLTNLQDWGMRTA